MSAVRRLLSSLVIASFTLALHASVPSVNSSATLHPHANPQFESSQVSSLGITSAPADASFYEEFYPLSAAHQAQPKTGMFHWVGSIIKKGRQKIALLSPQKFL
jgi:hypothetical protein